MLTKLFQVSGRRIHVNYFNGTQNRPVVDVRILRRLDDAGNVIEKGTLKKFQKFFLDKIQLQDSGPHENEKAADPVVTRLIGYGYGGGCA